MPLHIRRYTRKSNEKQSRITLIYKGVILGHIGLEDVMSFNRACLSADMIDEVTVLKEETARMSVSKNQPLERPRDAQRKAVGSEWLSAIEKSK